MRPANILFKFTLANCSKEFFDKIPFLNRDEKIPNAILKNAWDNLMLNDKDFNSFIVTEGATYGMALYNMSLSFAKPEKEVSSKKKTAKKAAKKRQVTAKSLSKNILKSLADGPKTTLEIRELLGEVDPNSVYRTMHRLKGQGKINALPDGRKTLAAQVN